MSQRSPSKARRRTIPSRSRNEAGVAGLSHLFINTRDFEAASRFWRDVVGGAVQATWGEDGHHAGLMHVGGLSVVVAEDAPEGAVGEFGYKIECGRPQIFLATPRIADLYESVKKRGATITRKLAKTHWGPKAFSVEGPEGLILSFIEPH